MKLRDAIERDGTETVKSASSAPCDLAKATRWFSAAALMAFLILGYALIAHWNQSRFENAHDPWTFLVRWDDRVPAVPWSIWIYVIYYPLILTPIFLVKDRAQLLEVLIAYLIVTVTAWISFLVIPVRMAYPDLTCHGLNCSMLEHLYSVDQGVNVFPSLHAAHSVLAAAIFCRYRSRLSGLMILGASLVCIAALLTRQHYLVDLPAGMLLGLGAWAITRRLSPVWSAIGERLGLLNLNSTAQVLEFGQE